MEIERKWLLPKDFVIADPVFKTVITKQFYIGDIRIRRTETKGIEGYIYYMAIKSDGTISREEWEVEIPEWVFNQLLLSNPYSPEIFKTVFKSRLNDLVLEFHIFAGKLPGLIVLECEFPNEDMAVTFELPKEINRHVIKEVTHDKNYQNKNLAVTGWPDKKREPIDIPFFTD